MLDRLNEIQFLGVIFVGVAVIGTWFAGWVWTSEVYGLGVGMLYILGTGLLLIGLGKWKEVITNG